MKKDDNNFMEDFMKLTGSAMSTAFNSMTDAKKSFEEMVEQKIDHILKKQGYVGREEFEVVKAMAQKAREENEDLEKKLKKLEKKLDGKK